MKRLLMIFTAVVAFASVSSAQQRAGTSEGVGGFHYQHLFLDDSDMIDYSGGFVIDFGSDHFITETVYAGFSLGYSYSIITSDFSGISSSAEVHDLRLPIRAGLASADSKFKFDTGPFLDFSIAGKSEVSYGSEKSVTRLKDMDVKRVSLGWGVNMRLFGFLTVGYGVKLTDSPFGEGGDMHILTVGITL